MPPDKEKNEIDWHRREIARLSDTIEKVKSDSAYGEQKLKVLASLDRSLQRLCERLAELETARR